MTKSPRRLKQQVQETVGEQVRDLPLHAVRLAMFGVGRALLLTDRVTKDYKEITEGGGVRPVLGRLRADVQHTAEKVVGHVVERVRGEEHEPEPAPRGRVAEPPARSQGDSEISVGKPAPSPGPAPSPEPAPPAEQAAAPKPAPEPEPGPTPAPEPVAKPEPADAEPADAEPVAADESSGDEAAFEPKPELKPAAQAEAQHVAADLPVPDYDEATLPQLRARLRGLSADQVKLLREYERKHSARPDVLRMYENRISKLNGLN